MEIRIKNADATKKITTQDSNILKTLSKNSIFINAYCGGRGICKKCKIRYIENAPNPNELEKQIFSEDELLGGFRLACLHKFNDNDYIEVFESKPLFSAISSKTCQDKEGSYIALDIGTTTIAASFLSNSKILKSINILNPQVSFGADVISRISYANENSKDILSNILNAAVKNIIDNFYSTLHIDSINEIVLAANPTMISFFLNKDPKAIGEYPYTPPFSGAFHTKWNGIDIYIPPVISAFVGSDITAGLLNVDMDSDFLFVDIGTNCEFILKYKDKIYSASIPGGPALEGNGIDYGTIAQNGAIDKVDFKGTLNISTIGSKEPTGIAGSGLISSIALLNKYGIIDKTGKIIEPWEAEDLPLQLLNRVKKEGFMLSNNIYLTQNSIREFQLVKASLNAGISILSRITGIEINKIEKIYFSGGFTKSLTKEEILNSNLLNIDKSFIMLGNSSISGALQLFCKKNRELLERLADKIEYIEIAQHKDFQKLYIENMDFV
jgi:uncharacterized 2Fe-2S/4Fe-4S cluster protein (DUF4445 family)